MVETKYIQDKSINRFYSTFVGGVIITSIVFLGNGTMTVANNYDSSVQLVRNSDNKTDMVKSYSYGLGMACSMPLYSGVEKNHGIEELIITDDKLESLKKLDIISNLKDNWNGNEAKAISNELINKVKEIIVFLDIQPDIFPTACDSIQIEYDKDDGKHMEIEFTEKGSAEVFMVDGKGNDTTKEIKCDFVTVNRVVNEFYG